MSKQNLFAIARFGVMTALGAACAASAWAQSSNVMRDQVHARQAARAAQLGVQLPEGSYQPEVVGGHIAKPGKWPFMVSLVDKNTPTNRDAHFCGGSLISKRDVLTAAHCAFPDDAGNLQVLVGTQDFAVGGRRVNVTRITQHPSYGTAGADSDVSVLRLAEDVTDIAPVAFMTTIAEEDQYASVDAMSYGMGWGEMEVKPHAPRRLHDVKVPIVDREVCNGPDSYNGDVDGTMICAGYKEGGKDTCQGDSGSPLVVRDAGKKWNLQVGVVSWGIGCAEPNYYGVYSRLATLGEWVKEQIAAP
jgi:secreted trypsin-like serine protease